MTIQKNKILRIIQTGKLFLFFIGLISCSSNHPIKYMGKLEAQEEIMLRAKTLNKDFILSGMPSKMIVLDSLLIVGDSYTQDNFIHLFHKNTGKWLASFGKRGNGPGELVHPIDLWLDKNRNLVAYSPNIQKMITYNLSDWIQGVRTFSEKKTNASPHFGVSHLCGSDNGIFVSGFTKEMRFGLYENDQIQSLYKEFPLIDADVSEDENAAIMVYGSKWDVSPDGRKMIQGTYTGAIIEIFAVDETRRITSVKLLPFIKPFYKVISGVKPFGTGWSMETVFGFHSFYVNNAHAYALFNGGKAEEDSFYAKQIVKFDWQGNILTNYKLDIPVSNFVLDDQTNTIYAVTISDEADPEIVMFELPLPQI